MVIPTKQSESIFYQKLKWFMFFRVLLTVLLLGSTIILQLGENSSPMTKPLLVLYGLIVGIFFISFIYAIIIRYIKREILFAYIQAGIDTFIVTLIIFVTGGYASVFSFIYLVIIIYSSMLIFMRGSMVMASLCSLQYGILIALEYYQALNPFLGEGNLAASNYAWGHIFYNVIITTAACFGVAFLSGFLSEQTRKTKNELLAMEDYVKRVDKMAAIGEMAAGLAHELKNPLASLTGSIQLLREDLHYDPAHDRLIQIFLREANRLSSLVNNFLLFAKMPDGKLEPVELGRDIAETIELFEKDSTWNKKISITKELPPGIWIEIDPVHLRQIFWNLIVNAAEAIDDEGRIDIKTYTLKGMYAGVKIADNGCGMSKDMISSIFDPFFTTKQSGTGLGLSIVHSIIESYDSRLDIESEVNKGTTVTLTFRRIDPPASSG